MPKKTPVLVDRKFLNDLARDIYDSKTHKFMRLCDGKLTNGPDPTQPKRKMHCGLGELYFAMTGRHTNDPKYPNVNEEKVIQTALELSTLTRQAEEARDDAERTLSGLNVADHVRQSLLKTFNGNKKVDNFIDRHAEEMFREELNDIPAENDDQFGDECGQNGCVLLHDTFPTERTT